jgi:hypothetical protein
MMLQRTVLVINNDKSVLQVLDFMEPLDFITLGIGGGTIVWIYKGLSMLIPAARIQNMVRILEAEKHNNGKTKIVAIQFRSDEAIKLPQQIANALLGDS